MNYKFDFVSKKKLFFTISGVMVALGLISLLLFGLNLGIDFKSGSRLDIDIGKAFDQNDVTQVFKDVSQTAKDKGLDVELKPSVVRTAGNDNEIAVVRFDNTLDSKVLPLIKDAFHEKYGDQVSLQESTVDPTRGKELALKAIYAVLAASLGIIIYVTIRFEFRFAVSAIVALLHDAFFVITMFSLLRTEVDLPFIAAVLTVVGYSVNDTIVIFDRIRENLKHSKVKKYEDLAAVVNSSLNQTLARSINTVLTVLITAAALFFFGGQGIHNFSLALLLGLISGTYSSIFIASQLWLAWKGHDLKKNKFQPQTEA